MAVYPPTKIQNRLLSSLPTDILARIATKLTVMDLPVRLGIYAARGLIDAVYFPEAGMISLVANMNDGMQAEVGVIGREGMLGTSLISGTDTSFVEAFVQMPGSALRMSAADFRAELDANGPFRHHVLQYQEALHIQIMQTAACNVCHGLEQRLARWLLMAHDRIGGTDVPLTQELLAMMLGVHRPSVTVIARVLQRAGLVRYASGQITILDRPGLENTSCECYAMVRQRFEMLLGANTFSAM